MKSFLILPLIALSFAHAAEPNVTLAGMQVVFDDGEKEFNGFRTFNATKGHAAALIVRSDGKTMVGFDKDKATITLGGAKTSCSFFSSNGFSDDRLAMKLEFRTTESVEPDADGNIRVMGNLPVTLASGKAETRSARFEAKVGTAVKFPKRSKGVPALKIKSIDESSYDKGAYEVMFSTNRQFEEYAGFQFYTEDGKPVEADKIGSSWSSSFGRKGKGSGSITFKFKAKPDVLIVAVETWTNSEDVTLQVDLAAGFASPKP